MLKKIIVVPEKLPKKEELEEFEKLLKKEEIACAKESPETFLTAEKKLQQAGGKGKQKPENYGILVISDSPEVCGTAIQRGYSSIAYLQSKKEYENVRYAIECFAGLDRQYLERVCLRYAGLPWKILETERCLVRETMVEDVDAFYDIYGEPSITAYMENLFADREEEIRYTKGYIENVYTFYEYGLWTVLDKKSGQIVGRAGISWREDTETTELGYVIAKPFQHKGIAFEVCQAILCYAREELGIEEVCAYIKKENAPSKALIRKLGFVLEKKIMLGGEEYEKWVRKQTGCKGTSEEKDTGK